MPLQLILAVQTLAVERAATHAWQRSLHKRLTHLVIFFRVVGIVLIHKSYYLLSDFVRVIVAAVYFIERYSLAYVNMRNVNKSVKENLDRS